MTNLEWIRTLSEEEFADWLYDEWLHHLQYRWSSSRGGLIIWLKDRKTEPQTDWIKGEDAIKAVDICVQDSWYRISPSEAKQNIRDLISEKDEPQTERSFE